MTNKKQIGIIIKVVIVMSIISAMMGFGLMAFILHPILTIKAIMAVFI